MIYNYASKLLFVRKKTVINVTDKGHTSVDNVHVIREDTANSANVTAPKVPVKNLLNSASSKYYAY